VTPLPAALGGSDLVAWRLDQLRFAASWDSGEGAYQVGGRWNGRGTRAVYCAFDPSTAILEVAVHKGFVALDTLPHVLTALTIDDPEAVHIVMPNEVPNPAWLQPGIPGRGQQRFGDTLLQRHGIFAIPSAVSRQSWNVVFDASRMQGGYSLRSQERFSLDTRLNPPAP